MPDPDTAPLVIQAFELVASGLYSVHEVNRRLARRGFCGKKGGKISTSTLHGFLKNPIYAGLYDVGGKINKSGRGGWEPLIPEDLWNRCQARLEGPSPCDGAR